MDLILKSPSFAHNSRIPRRFSKEGDDISPALEWSGAPEGTKEFALICEDPDAPKEEPWVHWLTYKIPGALSKLPENVAKTATFQIDDFTICQGRNSWNEVGYGGPMPPRGHGAHHYYFTLFALNTELPLAAGIEKSDLSTSLQPHVIGKAELIGTYERPALEDTSSKEASQPA
jgi:Raf kinase inhibitor-like YbhB/YbcL family protein